MKRKNVRLFAALAAVVLAVACRFPWHKEDADTWVARFRGGEVTLGQLEAHARRTVPASGLEEFMSDPERRRVEAQRLALREIASAKAREAGLAESTEYLEAMDAFRVARLARLAEDRVRAETAVSDEEVSRMAPSFPGEVVAEWAMFATRERAERFLEEVRGGGDFSALSLALETEVGARYGQSRVVEGQPAMMSPGALESLFQLKEGEIGPVIEEQVGFLVFRAVEVTTPEMMKKAWIDGAREALLKERQAQAVESTVAGLQREADIRVFEAVLKDPAAAAAGQMVAMVNGRGISLRDALPHGFPQHGDIRGIVQGKLEEIIRDILLAGEAERRGIPDTPEFLAEEEAASREKLQNLYLDSAARGLAVSEEEVRAYYRAHLEDFQEPVEARLAHVILASRFLADRFRADIVERGKPFEEVARKQSEDPESARRGGEIGWFRENALQEPFSGVVKSLAEGEVSEPLSWSEKWFLVKVLERRGGEAQGFEQVAGRATSRALLSKQSQAKVSRAEALLEEAGVELNERLLSRGATR